MPEKMKLYVAERVYDHEGSVILGVFSTKEKAQEVCDTDLLLLGQPYGDSHEVTEYVLDEKVYE